jgi:hypothetical protein
MCKKSNITLFVKFNVLDIGLSNLDNILLEIVKMLIHFSILIGRLLKLIASQSKISIEVHDVTLSENWTI